MRRSTATTKNSRLGDWSRWARRKDNLNFFGEALRVMNEVYHVGNQGRMCIALIGSRDMPGICLRRAQSVLRWDRRPSLWSHALLFADTWTSEGKPRQLPIFEVPLFPRNGRFPLPEFNGVLAKSDNSGIQPSSVLGQYANARLDANVALLCLARRGEKGKISALSNDDLTRLADRARDPNHDRLRYDLWESLSAWQRFLWSNGDGINPVREGIPIPGSAYIEMVFEALRLDLVPGASERNSAPEHLWNAALWWHQDSSSGNPVDDNPFVMTGCYALRDPGAAMLGTDEA